MNTQNPYGCIRFSVGAIGVGIFSTAPSVMLLFYLTDVLGVVPHVAGIVAFFPKFIDMVTDPMIGFFSDRTRTRWGRRKPFMLFGSLLAGPTFAIIFSGVNQGDSASIILVIISYSLCAIFFTFFTIPYISLCSELGRTYDDKTRINAYRLGFSMLGILIGGGLPPVLINIWQDPIIGYRMMGIMMGIICVVVMVFSTFFSKEPENNITTAIPFKSAFALLLHHKGFWVLLSSYWLVIAGTACTTAALPYYVNFYLARNSELVTSMFVASFGSAIITIPFWCYVGKKLGKLRTIQIATVLYSLVNLGIFLLPNNVDLLTLLVLFGIGGACFGCQQVFSYSMLADMSTDFTTMEQPANTALYSGVFISSEKLAFAIGPLIVGFILSAFNYEAHYDNSGIQQSESALQGIAVSMSLVAVISNILGALLFARYKNFENTVNLIHKST